MNGLIKVLTLVVSLLIVSQAFAWDDICKIGEEMNYMTHVQLTDYYKDNLQARTVQGKGTIRNVLEYGVNKYHAVRVDCGNNVIVNIATTSRDLKYLKTGQTIEFDGNCISYSRRLYVDTKQPYMHFELERGNVK